jgi:hypothetical protein
MLNLIFLKPGSIPYLGLASEEFRNQSSRLASPQSDIHRILADGLDTLLTGSRPTCPEIKQVVCGYHLTPEMVRTLYPDIDGEILKTMTGYLQDQPYGLIFLDSDIPFSEWKTAKGRYATSEHPEGTGARKTWRQIIQQRKLHPDISGIKPPVTENYIHSVDTEKDAIALHQHLSEKSYPNPNFIIVYQDQSYRFPLPENPYQSHSPERK